MSRWWLIVLAGLLAGTAFAAAPALTPYPTPGPAPPFALEDMHGKTHTLTDYRGKVVVVNFWATWCPPCVKEMPSLERAWKKWREEGIQVLAINMGDPPVAIEDFLQRYPVTFPVLLDNDVTVAKAWKVRGLPSTFIVDANGQRVWQAIGEREWDDPALLEQIRAVKK